MSRAGRQWGLNAALGATLLHLAWTGSAVAQPAGASLELVNRAPMAITDLRLASRVMGNWGKNLLTSRVDPGQQRVVTPEKQEGCLYSIRVGYGDNRFERFVLIDLCQNREYVVAGRFARSPAADNDTPPASEVSIANRSSVTIRVVRMSPVGERMWGPDRLGDQLLQAGKKINVVIDRNRGCKFRIYAYYDDSRVEVIPSADLCNDSYVSFRRAAVTSFDRLPEDMRVRPTKAIYVSNQSGLQIDWVYVFPTNDRNRGSDRLANKVLPSGRDLRVDVSDQSLCLVAVLAVYQDRREERVPSLDLCASHEPRVTMRGPSGSSSVQNNPQQGLPSRP